ncbi:hypothetical protein E5D57_002612 [Metarhizium anisopliae]|nr:hypothetical protein E5D57_002612 [Metarhizium anisopliae]
MTVPRAPGDSGPDVNALPRSQAQANRFDAEQLSSRGAPPQFEQTMPLNQSTNKRGIVSPTLAVDCNARLHQPRLVATNASGG